MGKTGLNGRPHAEHNAIEICKNKIRNSSLYVTIEPCLMCAGAMVHARIGTLVFGALEPRTGVVRSRMRVFDEAFQNHRVEVVEGVLEEQSARRRLATDLAWRHPLGPNHALRLQLLRLLGSFPRCSSCPS